MKFENIDAGRRTVKCALMFALPTIAIALFVPSAGAQTQATGSKSDEAQTNAKTYQTLYLTNLTQQSDALDIQTDLRNMLPRAKIYYVPPENAISILGTQEDFLLAKQILADIDRKRNIYRLTYTITESDGVQNLGTRHVALIVASGGTAELKQGNRVPVMTGANGEGTSNANSQVQYMDVGLNILAVLNGAPDDLRLRTRVEQTSVAEERSGLGPQDPVIHQTSLDETSTLVQGKPVVLGSLDIPNSSRHMQIEVNSEPVQ
jgi:hypothetical protein